MKWEVVSRIPRNCIIAFCDDFSFNLFINELLGIHIFRDVEKCLYGLYKEPFYKHCAFRIIEGVCINSGNFHGGCYETDSFMPDLPRCIFSEGIEII